MEPNPLFLPREITIFWSSFMSLVGIAAGLWIAKFYYWLQSRQSEKSHVEMKDHVSKKIEALEAQNKDQFKVLETLASEFASYRAKQSGSTLVEAVEDIKQAFMRADGMILARNTGEYHLTKNQQSIFSGVVNGILEARESGSDKAKFHGTVSKHNDEKGKDPD